MSDEENTDDRTIRTIQKEARFGDWRDTFIDALRESPNVTDAAALSGRARSTVYEERDRDPAFKAAWEDAKESGIDALEEAVFRAAKTPADNPTLAIFMLKCLRRAVYGDHLKVDSNVTVREVSEAKARAAIRRMTPTDRKAYIDGDEAILERYLAEPDAG